ADDSSYGFDNISEALTVSPTLIEKYVKAAEKIAPAALGTGALPKPMRFEARRSDRNIRRIKASTAETSYRINSDAEYIVRVRWTGKPPKDTPTPSIGFWVDGKLLASNPLSPASVAGEHIEETRFYVESGEHVFRAGVVGDTAPVPVAVPGGAGAPPPPNVV